MFPFPSKNRSLQPQKSSSSNYLPKPKQINRLVKIPIHFQKNNLVTYSESEINQELQKYPGLLKTLAHAYQYQIIYTNSEREKEYWFCRNLQVTMPLLKYLNQQGWQVDWQEKPFSL